MGWTGAEWWALFAYWGLFLVGGMRAVRSIRFWLFASLALLVWPHVRQQLETDGYPQLWWARRLLFHYFNECNLVVHSFLFACGMTGVNFRQGARFPAFEEFQPRFPEASIQEADPEVWTDDTDAEKYSRYAVIAVHGTNDQLHGTDQLKWWQYDSSFCKAYLERLEEIEIESDSLDWVSFRWSGRNDEAARRLAAKDLQTLVSESGYERVQIVAHSHGGNVVRLMNWSAIDTTKVISVVTVGTPYLRYSRGLQAGYFWPAFLGAVLLGGVGIALFATFITLLFVAGILILLLAILSFIYLVEQLGACRPPNRHEECPIGNEWVSVLTNGDEAILLLDFLSRPLQFGSRQPEIRYQTRLYLVALSVSVEVLFVAALIFPSMIVWAELGSLWGALSLLVGAVAIAFGYRHVRLNVVAGLRTAHSYLTMQLQSRMNGIASAQIRRSAFGETGAYGISGVQHDPWFAGAGAVQLPPEVSESLLEFSTLSAAETLRKVRLRLDRIALAEQPDWKSFIDEVTWGELLHTSYFRDEKASTFIASLASQRLAAIVLGGNVKVTRNELEHAG